MKVEFLTSNVGRVIKGRRNKTYANVHRDYPGGYWFFSDIQEKVGFWLDNWLDRKAKRYILHLTKKKADEVWKPCAKLPEARLLIDVS